VIRSDNAGVQGFYAAIGYAPDQVAVYSRRLTTDEAPSTETDESADGSPLDT
jgi:hypothetical protein